METQIGSVDKTIDERAHITFIYTERDLHGQSLPIIALRSTTFLAK